MAISHFYILLFLVLVEILHSSVLYSDLRTDSDDLIDEYLEAKRKAQETQWVSFKSSFYSREEVNDNMPASGIRGVTLKEAKKGLGRLQVSVDPKQIPLYTRFKVKLWDGWTVIPAMALDIGPHLIIDIYVDNVTEAINYGIKNVKVMFEN